MNSVMEISVQGESSPELSLNITLTNRTEQLLTTYRHSLPWVGWNSMLLVAVKTDALGTVLDKNLPIDDPGPDEITIEPGETLTGRIPLASRFPDLPDALNDRDVVVFWSYRFQPTNAASSERYGGWALFEKQL